MTPCQSVRRCIFKICCEKKVSKMGGKSEKTWFGPCFVFITLGDLGVLKCRNSNAKTRFLGNCQLIIVTFPGGNPSQRGCFSSGNSLPKQTSIQIVEVVFYPPHVVMLFLFVTWIYQDTMHTFRCHMYNMYAYCFCLKYLKSCTTSPKRGLGSRKST